MPAALYPWDEWFDRAKQRPVKLARYRHFECQPHSMSSQIRNAASERRLRMSVFIDEDSVTFQVVGKI